MRKRPSLNVIVRLRLPEGFTLPLDTEVEVIAVGLETQCAVAEVADFNRAHLGTGEVQLVGRLPATAFARSCRT